MGKYSTRRERRVLSLSRSADYPRATERGASAGAVSVLSLSRSADYRRDDLQDRRGYAVSVLSLEGRTKHTAALSDWDKTYRGCDGCGNQSAMLVVATAFRSIPLVRRACLATSGIGAFSHPFSGFRRTTTEPA